MRIYTRAELHHRGMSDVAISRAVVQGRLHRVSRGRYSFDVAPTALVRHEALMGACRGQVLGLESAALALGLPVDRVPQRVQVIASGTGRSWTRGDRQLRTAPLPESHLQLAGPHLVTSVARTIVDLARLRRPVSALITWEAALREAGDRASGLRLEVDEVLGVLRGRQGIAKARHLHGFASALSESPKESESRWLISDLGLPDPVQQFEVFDGRGRLLGRADFAWPERGVLGEYDGEGKYEELARPGQSPRDVVLEERRRQQGMEQEGWTFSRWGKAELRAPSLLLECILTAFARADSGQFRPRLGTG